MTTPTDVTALARRFRLEIDMSPAQDGSDWQLCPGVTDFSFKADPEIQDGTSYDTDGWAENVKSLQSWEVDATFNRKASADNTTFNPVHEALRAAAFGWGATSQVSARWYDRNGLPEAYQGIALVTWEPSGGDAKSLDQIKATLTGSGPLALIDNPGVGS